MPRGRPRKNKEVPLSKESEVLVKKGLQEAKEGKIELNPLLEERKNKAALVIRELNKSIDGINVDFANNFIPRERLSLGYKCLDKLTGGGIPCGQCVTVWGSKGVGKTTIAYKTVATAQKNGKIAAYIDMERSYDPTWATKFGVKVEDLIYISAHTAEEAFDAIIKLCKEKVVDLIILDSIQGLSPKGENVAGKAEKERSVEDDSIALLARKLSQFFRMATAHISDAKCAILLIGQARMDLGSFIKLETLSGGRALLHNSRLIIKMRKGQGADAPVIKKETEDGKKESVKIGFDLVFHVDISQLSGCVENSSIHVPFLYESGINE